MNVRRPTLTILVLASLGLAACATKPKPAPATPPPSTEAPTEPAEPGAPADRGTLDRTAQEDLAATAGDRVYFAFDEDGLDGEARATLTRQAAWLAAHQRVRALIAGNADERGTREYNLALGARRAAATRQFLLRQGIASDRIDTISYGKERPIDPASNEEAWARNRNAQTIVITPTSR